MGFTSVIWHNVSWSKSPVCCAFRIADQTQTNPTLYLHVGVQTVVWKFVEKSRYTSSRNCATVDTLGDEKTVTVDPLSLLACGKLRSLTHILNLDNAFVFRILRTFRVLWFMVLKSNLQLNDFSKFLESISGQFAVWSLLHVSLPYLCFKWAVRSDPGEVRSRNTTYKFSLLAIRIRVSQVPISGGTTASGFSRFIEALRSIFWFKYYFLVYFDIPSSGYISDANAFALTFLSLQWRRRKAGWTSIRQLEAKGRPRRHCIVSPGQNTPLFNV